MVISMWHLLMDSSKFISDMNFRVKKAPTEGSQVYTVAYVEKTLNILLVECL